VQHVALVPLIGNERIKVIVCIVNNTFVDWPAATITGDELKALRYRSSQSCSQLCQPNAVLHIAFLLTEKLLSGLLDHLTHVAGLSKVHGVEDLVGGFNLPPKIIVLVLLGPSALFSQESRPVLIEYKQVGREELPILLRLEQFLLSQPHDFVGGIQNILTVDRKYANIIMISIVVIADNIFRDVGPQQQKLRPGIRFGQVLRFECGQHIFLADLVYAVPVDQLLSVLGRYVMRENRSGAVGEQARDKIVRPYVEENPRHGNTAFFLCQRSVFQQKEWLTCHCGFACLFGDPSAVAFQRMIIAIKIR